MKKYLTKNWHIKLLALLVASSFWFFILSSENTFFEFPDNLTIETFNVPEGLAVVNELGTANITIRADQEIYKTLTPDNFTVYVDLQGLAADSKRVDISVNSKQSDVSVVNVDPASVQVVLESLTTKEVPLVYELEGDPEDNYAATLLGGELDTVLISGAESVLEEVEEAVAILTLQGSEITDTTNIVEIYVRDQDDELVSQVSVEPKTADVAAAIELEQAQKTVGIKVNVEADGWISKVTVTPQVVIIKGDAEVLESIDYLETELIEIQEWDTFYEGTVELIIPDQVSLVENEPSEVNVSVMSVDDEV